ncbi:unnamed protein product [Rotaria socialis]|uniref:Uncharacterized protein n=1 Tax=Rotaria socialis TaxID=392032 RepID=A0A821NR44_9BILA|nr:unnamed protein product [Rotaria socialis]CAF4789371.1 unnamed protein product [Rotaria socialis]
MNRSSKLKKMLTKKEDLWKDSNTVTPSIVDKNRRKKSTRKTFLSDSEKSTDDNSQSCTKDCCFICSILPGLSHINTCNSHLKLLTKQITSRKVTYMMHSKIDDCQSSSSASPSHRGRRSMILSPSDSSSQDDLFFSPDVKFQEPMTYNEQHQIDHIQAPLSPSLPSSSTASTTLEQFHELFFTPILQCNKQQSLLKDIQNKSIQEEVPQTNAEVNASFSTSFYCPLDANDCNDEKNTTADTDQLRELILTDTYFQPIILLERIQFEKG